MLEGHSIPWPSQRFAEPDARAPTPAQCVATQVGYPALPLFVHSQRYRDTPHGSARHPQLE